MTPLTAAMVDKLRPYLSEQAIDVIAQGYPKVVDSAARLSESRAYTVSDAATRGVIMAEVAAMRAIAVVMQHESAKADGSAEGDRPTP